MSFMCQHGSKDCSCLMCLRPYLSKNQLEKHQVISLIGFLQIHFDLQFFVSNKVGDMKGPRGIIIFWPKIKDKIVLHCGIDKGAVLFYFNLPLYINYFIALWLINNHFT